MEPNFNRTFFGFLCTIPVELLNAKLLKCHLLELNEISIMFIYILPFDKRKLLLLFYLHTVCQYLVHSKYVERETSNGIMKKPKERISELCVCCDFFLFKL